MKERRRKKQKKKYEYAGGNSKLVASCFRVQFLYVRCVCGFWGWHAELDSHDSDRKTATYHTLILVSFVSLTDQSCMRCIVCHHWADAPLVRVRMSMIHPRTALIWSDQHTTNIRKTQCPNGSKREDDSTSSPLILLVYWVFSLFSDRNDWCLAVYANRLVLFHAKITTVCYYCHS